MFKITVFLWYIMIVYFLFLCSMVAADVDPSVCDTPAAVGRSTSNVTPSPSTSSRPPRPSPRELQHRKRPRSSQDEDIDTAIIEGFCESRERWEKRVKDKTEQNPDMHFGRDVGERLYRMTPRQKALAKVRIQQVLLEVEFPSEQYYQQPMPPLPPPQFMRNSNT